MSAPTVKRPSNENIRSAAHQRLSAAHSAEGPYSSAKLFDISGNKIFKLCQEQVRPGAAG